MTPNIFDQGPLERIIDQTLRDTPVPAGHGNAIIGTVDAKGTQFLVSLQREERGATWQVQGLIRHDWAGDTSIGGRVIVSW